MSLTVTRRRCWLILSTRIPPPFLFVPLFTCSRTGKTGIGGVKRPPSPTTLERAAKVAKQSETLTADEFRTRARKEYEDRRAEGRLRHARTTCVSLDTKADVKVRVKTSVERESCSEDAFLPFIQFNRFWLDADNLESFPPGLLEALEELWTSSPSGDQDPGPLRVVKSGQGGADAGTAARLKAQMQADGLRPLDAGSIGNEEDDERRLRMGAEAVPDGKDHDEAVAVWPEETLIQAGDYLRLSVSRILSPQLSVLLDDRLWYPRHARSLLFFFYGTPQPLTDIRDGI